MRISLNTHCYRCYYTPRDALGSLNLLDTGVSPFVQLHAANAEHPQGLAQQVSGCPVIETVRIEA